MHTHTVYQVSLSQVSSVQQTLWFVYIAFNYLPVSLVELYKMLYCGYYSLDSCGLLNLSIQYSMYINHIVRLLCLWPQKYTTGPWHLEVERGEHAETAATRLLPSSLYYIRCPHYPFLVVCVCRSAAMCLYSSELCWLPPSLLSHGSNLSRVAVLDHLPSSLQQIIIFIEKPAMVLAGIRNPQLRHQRNDHCKSHSVNLSGELSHGCQGDHDVIVKAILFWFK